MIVYISIGNSDDKLSQQRWSDYWLDIDNALLRHQVKIHGSWQSPAAAPWQNSCWCVEFPDDRERLIRAELRDIRMEYHQESVAWAVARTEFI